MIHLVIDIEGFVYAHFARSEDANTYAQQHHYIHLPFNLANRDKEAAPLVGTFYRA